MVNLQSNFFFKVKYGYGENESFIIKNEQLQKVIYAKEKGSTVQINGGFYEGAKFLAIAPYKKTTAYITTLSATGEKVESERVEYPDNHKVVEEFDEYSVLQHEAVQRLEKEKKQSLIGRVKNDQLQSLQATLADRAGKNLLN